VEQIGHEDVVHVELLEGRDGNSYPGSVEEETLYVIS
jgi:hypothetical protein